MKIVFFGTPDFAQPCLKALAGAHEVVCVVTQPDRAGNRGKVVFSPVKAQAIELGIPVLQPERIKLALDEVRAYGADIGVTCAYGQILNQAALDLFPYGIINVHGSLLPAYRGSSPIQWSIIKGETVTGVTVMQTALGVDSGDIILQRELAIGAEETAGELFDRMAQFAPDVLLTALAMIQNGTATRTPQEHEKATHYPMLDKTSGVIDWTKSATEIVNLVRGVHPWPGATATVCGEVLKVHKATLADGAGEAGTVLKSDGKSGLVIAAGQGAVRLDTVQRAGKRAVKDVEYLCGNAVAVGTKLC